MTDTADNQPTEQAPPSTVKPIPPSAEPPRERRVDGTFAPAGPESSKPTTGATDLTGLPPRDLDVAPLDLEDKDYPIETLPGLMDERKDAARPVVKGRKTALQRLAEARPAQPSDAPVEGQAAKPAADAPTTPVDPNAPPPEGAAAKFKIRAGRDDAGNPVFEEFDSEEKFHENWRTIRGMYKREVSTRTNAEEMARRNYQAAVDWKAKAEAYERGELQPPTTVNRAGQQQPGTNGQPAAGTQPSGAQTQPEDEVVSRIDWKAYDAAKRQANAKVAAGEWTQADAETVLEAWKMREVAKNTAAVMEARTNARFEEMGRPAKEVEAIRQHGAEMGERIAEIRDITDNAGNALYPEFSDPEVFRELGAVTAQRAADGVSWDYLKSHKGIHESVLLWRNWRQMSGRPWQASAPQAPPPPSNPQAGVDEAMRSIEGRNAGVVAGRSAPIRPAGVRDAASSFRQGVMNAGKMGPLGYPD